MDKGREDTVVDQPQPTLPTVTTHLSACVPAPIPTCQTPPPVIGLKHSHDNLSSSPKQTLHERIGPPLGPQASQPPHQAAHQPKHAGGSDMCPLVSSGAWRWDPKKVGGSQPPYGVGDPRLQYDAGGSSYHHPSSSACSHSPHHHTPH